MDGDGDGKRLKRKENLGRMERQEGKGGKRIREESDVAPQLLPTQVIDLPGLAIKGTSAKNEVCV